jgi:hypothetical protein
MEDPSQSSHQHLTWEDFGRITKEFARDVSRVYKPELVVGIAKGGVIFGATIASVLRVDFFPIKLSRRIMAEVVQQEPMFHIKPYSYAKEKTVLLVDDVSETGETIMIAKRAIERFDPLAVKTATLARRSGGYKPDFCAIESDGFIVFPWEYEYLEEDEFVVNPDMASDAGYQKL